MLCTGFSAGCPGDTGSPDSDGDGIGNACDPCNDVLNVASTKTKLVVQKIDTPPGDDKFTHSGQAILPGGAYDDDTKVGWKVNKKGDAWTYVDRGTSPIAGVTGVSFKKSASAPGLYQWTVRGKDASLAITPSRLPLGGTFVVDSPTAETGQCAETRFGVGVCRLNPTGSSATCK